MNNIRNIIFLTATILFIACTLLAKLGGIGYFLYLWGALDYSLGLAAWEGFIVFLKFIGVSLVSFLVALSLKDSV